ncbi:hypothetical protein IAT40_000744 [Kwoniella sp. CBS 6097]
MQDISHGLESVPIPIRGVSQDSLKAVLGPFARYIVDSISVDGTTIFDSKSRVPESNTDTSDETVSRKTAESNPNVEATYDLDSDSSCSSWLKSHQIASSDTDISDSEGSTQDDDDEWTCSCLARSRNHNAEKWLCTVVDGGSCDCVSSFGNFYSVPPLISKDDRLRIERQTLNLDALPEKLPLVECSPLCACSDRCANRVTQQGVSGSLVIQPSSSGVGLGLFYSPSNGTALLRGSFISLYAGEYLTTEQARARWATQRDFDTDSHEDQEGQGNYILSLRLPGQVIHIDPRYKGNVGRFLNHSCDPNCVIHPAKWGADNVWYRAAIFTKRDIQPEEELTFDYANASGSSDDLDRGSSQPNTGPDDKKGRGVGRVRCLCGTDICRGWMPFDESL